MVTVFGRSSDDERSDRSMSVYNTAGEPIGMGNTGLVMTKLALDQVVREFI
jgi:hypothetical protein